MINEYTYEILSFLPEDALVKVKYEREGSLPFFKLLSLHSFDETSVRTQIENFAHVVFTHWSRAEIAPDALPLVGAQEATRVPVKLSRHIEPEVITDDLTEILVEVQEETEDEILIKQVVVPRPIEDVPFAVRNRRDFLLRMTDHYANADVSMPASIKVYRQELRDVTEQAGFPLSVVWPDLPVVDENSVPASISPRQARLALASQGLMTQMDAAIAAMPVGVKEAVEIEWEFASSVDRNSALLSSLGATLGLTEVQLDDLFKLAVTL